MQAPTEIRVIPCTLDGTPVRPAGPGLRPTEGAFRTALGSQSEAATLELVFSGPVPEDVSAAVNGADVPCERADCGDGATAVTLRALRVPWRQPESAAAVAAADEATLAITLRRASSAAASSSSEDPPAVLLDLSVVLRGPAPPPPLQPAPPAATPPPSRPPSARPGSSSSGARPPPSSYRPPTGARPPSARPVSSRSQSPSPITHSQQQQQQQRGRSAAATPGSHSRPQSPRRSPTPTLTRPSGGVLPHGGGGSRPGSAAPPSRRFRPGTAPPARAEVLSTAPPEVLTAAKTKAAQYALLPSPFSADRPQTAPSFYPPSAPAFSPTRGRPESYDPAPIYGRGSPFTLFNGTTPGARFGAREGQPGSPPPKRPGSAKYANITGGGLIDLTCNPPFYTLPTTLNLQRPGTAGSARSGSFGLPPRPSTAPRGLERGIPYSPGPQAYSPFPIQYVIPAAPSPTHGTWGPRPGREGRLEALSRGGPSPGPARYSPYDPETERKEAAKKVAAWRQVGEPKKSSRREKQPGPGQYPRPQVVGKEGRTWSFGVGRERLCRVTQEATEKYNHFCLRAIN